jgi:hypothetical protein
VVQAGFGICAAFFRIRSCPWPQGRFDAMRGQASGQTKQAQI